MDLGEKFFFFQAVLSCACLGVKYSMPPAIRVRVKAHSVLYNTDRQNRLGAGVGGVVAMYGPWTII